MIRFFTVKNQPQNLADSTEDKNLKTLKWIQFKLKNTSPSPH
jgi:hypothetical protein